ncbi:MAG: hypothetical protein GY778_29300 [bacterium]|nr:hypothetical protein [bacterium]
MQRVHALPLVWFAVAACPAVYGAPPGHGLHPPMPDQQLFLQCHLGHGDEAILTEVAIDLPSPTTVANLDQIVLLPAPLPPLKLEQYLPGAVLVQDVVPDSSPGAKPAVHLSIDGPSQHYLRWLVADDTDHDALISLIGTWRFMAVKTAEQRDELFRQFETELTREPTVYVSRRGKERAVQVPARPKTVRELKELGCTVRVLDFMPHFGLDDKTKEPVNRSDQRLNPAVLVEVEGRGQRDQRWIFSKFPEYQANERSELPFEVRLECAVAKQSSTPDFMLLTVGVSPPEAWIRQDGKTTVKRLKVDEKIVIAGSQYTFHIARFESAGKLVESFRPAEGGRGVRALRVRARDTAGQERTVWLEMGKQRVLATAVGPLTLNFNSRRSAPPGAHP